MNQPLKLSREPVTLDMRSTYWIAHGASDQRFNVITHLFDPQSGLTGVGERSEVSYHGEITHRDPGIHPGRCWADGQCPVPGRVAV